MVKSTETENILGASEIMKFMILRKRMRNYNKTKPRHLKNLALSKFVELVNKESHETKKKLK